jgi:hypothetical protein
MTHARTVWIVPCLLAAVAGCAQNGPFLSHQASMGTLKASVSHLEYENQQLRQQVTNLKAEQRQVEDRLVQEESLNGELQARLDDARALLSRRGDALEAPSLDPGTGTPKKTLPAGRSSRKGRKPPFAQIPGRIDTVPPVEEKENDDGADPNAPQPGWRGDPGPQSRRSDSTLWLPVARGADQPSAPRR